MEILVYLLSLGLAFFGLMFIVGSQGMVIRFFLGAVLLVSAGALVYLFRIKPKPQTLVQKIDLTGDMALEKLSCQACGASLGKDSVEVKAGAIFVNCQYCNHSYQLEEAPKW